MPKQENFLKEVDSFNSRYGRGYCLVQCMLPEREEIFHRNSMKAWWITGFKLTKKKFYSSQLVQKSTITFKSAKMRASFCKKFYKKKASVLYH